MKSNQSQTEVPYYCNSNSEAALGHGVKAFRDKVILSSKFPTEVAKNPGDFRRQLETTLTRLDTEYLFFHSDLKHFQTMYPA